MAKVLTRRTFKERASSHLEIRDRATNLRHAKITGTSSDRSAEVEHDDLRFPDDVLVPGAVAAASDSVADAVPWVSASAAARASR